MNRSVPGDLARSSLIERVEEHQEDIWVLKQEGKEHERTWNELAMARSLCVVFQTDLGELPNWGSMVINWRHERVDWMLNYLAEPMAGSIYRIHERWRLIQGKTRDGRREGGAVAQAIGGIYRGGLTDDYRVGKDDSLRHG
jgi:hypothetical protein